MLLSSAAATFADVVHWLCFVDQKAGAAAKERSPEKLVVLPRSAVPDDDVGDGWDGGEVGLHEVGHEGAGEHEGDGSLHGREARGVGGGKR